MKRGVVVLPEAARDVRRLLDYLRARNPQAAARARAVIGAGLSSLEEYADRGRPGPFDGDRELVLRFGRGAYVVLYRVRKDEVLVARLWHSREARD